MEVTEFLRAFRPFSPKVMKAFPQIQVYAEGFEGYVLFVETKFEDEPCFNELKEFAENRNLKIEKIRGYFMIYTP